MGVNPRKPPNEIWTNSLLKKENKIAFKKSEQKSIRGGLRGLPFGTRGGFSKVGLIIIETKHIFPCTM